MLANATTSNQNQTKNNKQQEQQRQKSGHSKKMKQFFKVLKTADGTSGAYDSDDENIDTYERSSSTVQDVTDVDDFIIHYGEVKRKSTSWGAVFNMTNSIIGAGIVGKFLVFISLFLYFFVYS